MANYCRFYHTYIFSCYSKYSN